MDSPKKRLAAPVDVSVAVKSIDENVSFRIRQRRIQLGMSQEDLARALGTTWQQIMKYEAYDNHITCGRLYELSRVLKVPVIWFFIGAEGTEFALGQESHQADLIRGAIEVELLQLVGAMTNPLLKLQLLKTAGVFAEIDRMKITANDTRRSAADSP